MASRARSTPFAVLGLLSLAPMSGYDIRRESVASLGHFWSESYGQIYPALRSLASAGLIRRRPGRRRGGRERQVYEISARGREALRQWRVRPPRETPARNELLLKIFFGDGRSLARNAEWIAILLAEEKSRLENYRDIRRQLEREQSDHPSLPFWLATLSYGEHRSRAIARWCRETLKSFRANPRGAEPEEPRHAS